MPVISAPCGTDDTARGPARESLAGGYVNEECLGVWGFQGPHCSPGPLVHAVTPFQGCTPLSINTLRAKPTSPETSFSHEA